MSKKDFIALADAIRYANCYASYKDGELSQAVFTDGHLEVLADFCKSRNSAFMRERWLGYIRGDNGPCGRDVKRHVA
jgi:hypothetical protein